MSRLKVLMSAYACEPGCGSEPGIGWNSVEQAARFCELWVLTRANNREIIERYTSQEPLSGVNWLYVDLPPWMRWWKRGPRGALLYYCLWQIAGYRAATRLHSTVNFDRIHHVTMGAYWMPTFLHRLPVPFIWGPVGGGETTPVSFYPSFSLSGRLHEHLRDAVRWFTRFQPTARATAQRARIVLATTVETAEQLRRIGARRAQVLSHTALPLHEFERLSVLPIRCSAPFRVISIGRLIHWKGYHLGLRAFAGAKRQLPDCEYWFIGDGPERKRLERLAIELDIAECVRFLGTLPRDQVLDTLSESDVLIHPSFHDSGGYVCVEAMAAGRPVICLNLGGPGVLVRSDTGIKIHPRDPEQTVEELAQAMVSLGTDPQLRSRLAMAARRHVRDHLLWDAKGAILQQLYSLVENESGAAAPELVESDLLHDR
jgi:glycosyltransferase involved in cell wall biosynthesis